MFDNLQRWLSKVPALPGLSQLSPPVNLVPSQRDLSGFLKSQSLARKAAKEVSAILEPGMTEREAADLLETTLRDYGVHRFFHHAFAWFGERARFDGIRHYQDFQGSNRRLGENEVFILDIAPIVDGFVSDIGYTNCIGTVPEWGKAKDFLLAIRDEIPRLFMSGDTGAEICKKVRIRMVSSGFDPIHEIYPFSVLGHRVHSHLPDGPEVGVLNFGWQSFWSLASRGLFGQLLNEHFEGDLTGLWAVEPHLGTKSFGAKFEEILVVAEDRAYWLSEEAYV